MIGSTARPVQSGRGVALLDGHAVIGWTESVMLKLAHGHTHHALIKVCDHAHPGVRLHCTFKTLQKQKTRLTKKINFFHKKSKRKCMITTGKGKLNSYT